MAYEQIRMGRQKVLYNSTNPQTPLMAQLVVAGAKVTPASATITIYRSGVSTALVTAAAMTVSGSLLSYSVTTTTVASWPIEGGYRADLAITVGAVVHVRHLVFDVVRYAVVLQITRDQLVALDDSIVGMQHNSDDDFSPLIEAVRDEMQVALESKIVRGGKLVENYILDPSAASVAGRLAVLAQLHFNKGSKEKYDTYRERFDTMLSALLSTLQFDTGQSGSEGGELGGVHEVTLVP